MQELRQRNEARVKEAIEKLGDRYLLHPKNHITSKKYRGVIESQRVSSNLK